MEIMLDMLLGDDHLVTFTPDNIDIVNLKVSLGNMNRECLELWYEVMLIENTPGCGLWYMIIINL